MSEPKLLLFSIRCKTGRCRPHRVLAGVLLAILAGCSAHNERDRPDPQALGIPAQWQGLSAADNSLSPQNIREVPETPPTETGTEQLYSPLLAATGQTRWVKRFQDPALTLLVERVLANNAGLAAEAAKVESAGAGRIQANAALYPTLDLTGSISERQTGDIRTDSQEVSLNAGFELDLWGKLSAREQQASLDFAAARADFSEAALALSADTATAWYNLITQKQLLELYQRREDTLRNALKVVEQGYNNGLKELEDLLQARQNLENEQDNLKKQRQMISEQVRALQVLLGRYPDGRLLNEAGMVLPDLPPLVMDTLPSELISRSPSLQSQWLSLLAADAGLAAANRDRFPSLSLSASVDDAIDWNLMAQLTQPLFNAGKLAAAEDQAAATVAGQEKNYLQSLFATFADVENALMQETTLAHRYRLSADNLQRARETTELTLSRYQLGLTELDALLTTQKNMLDAEAQLITLRNQQLANRIELYRLMGGEPPDTNPVKKGAAL